MARTSAANKIILTMKQIIAHYKRYVDHGYDRLQIKEMLEADKSLTEAQRTLILDTLFPTYNGKK